MVWGHYLQIIKEKNPSPLNWRLLVEWARTLFAPWEYGTRHWYHRSQCGNLCNNQLQTSDSISVPVKLIPLITCIFLIRYSKNCKIIKMYRIIVYNHIADITQNYHTLLSLTYVFSKRNLTLGYNILCIALVASSWSSLKCLGHTLSNQSIWRTTLITNNISNC